jgi:hypothetical protein
MKLLTLVLLFMLCFSPTAKQDDELWKTLLSVKYDYKTDAYIPKFTDKIKALDNKTLTIQGYMYALEEAPKHIFFMLSYYPVNMCFFCGGAGPESVIEVNLKKAVKHTNRQIQIRGRLKLNATDRERLFYILLDAEVVE